MYQKNGQKFQKNYQKNDQKTLKNYQKNGPKIPSKIPRKFL